jgi:hypothetical protein
MAAATKDYLKYPWWQRRLTPVHGARLNLAELLNDAFSYNYLKRIIGAVAKT